MARFHVFLRGHNEFSTVTQMYVGSAETFEAAIEKHALYHGGGLSEVDILSESEGESDLVEFASIVTEKMDISNNEREEIDYIIYANGVKEIRSRRRQRRVTVKERIEMRAYIEALLIKSPGSFVSLSEWRYTDD